MPGKHSERAHAVLSASAADRWMHCTPSAQLTKDMPDTRSVYSDEGTRAHELAEQMLRQYLKAGTFDFELFVTSLDKDLRGTAVEVLPYVEHCIATYESASKDHADTVMFIEVKVDFSRWVPEGFGTSDCIILSGNWLYCIDLKFGKGVPVYANGNPQERCYCLGAYEMFSDLYDIDHIICRIDQPRLDNLSEEEMPVQELLDWADKELKPAAELAAQGGGEFKAGDWCRFCKARATCPHRAIDLKHIAPAVQEAKAPALLTMDEVSDLLYQGRMVAQYVKQLEEYVIDQLSAGVSVPGWKLVEGRSTRKITDDAEAARKLTEAGIDEALIYKKSLYGLTDLTKIVGGKKKLEDILGDLIVKPPGKPALVPDEDTRPALISDAAKAFEGINIEEE